MRRHEEEEKHGGPTSFASHHSMLHFCANCVYESEDRWCVRRHQSKKHKTGKEDVVEHPLHMPSEEQPSDGVLMEDSIVVFKINKLLQRMKYK